MTIEKELNCMGYYGFGNGIEISRMKRDDITPEPGSPAYCGRCPLGQKCWEKHRERVRVMLPDLSAAFDEVAARHKGNPKGMMEEWTFIVKSDKQPDPYTTVMGGNMQDGCYVVATGRPKDREEGTIPFPFITH